MASQSSWSDLPGVILELIFDIVKDPVDIVRCGAACKSWLPIALQVYPKFLHLCLILTGKVDSSSRVLFNYLTKEIRKIQIPEAVDDWIYSSSNSWLLVLDSTRVCDHGMKLLNIFSRIQIDLPPLPIGYNQLCRYGFDWKLLLSNCPLDSDCILFLLEKPPKAWCTISSLKPGQNMWSYSKLQYEKIYDAVLYKGKLYATISNWFGKPFLVTCNYELQVEAKVSIPDPTKKYFKDHFVVKSFNDNCLLVGDSSTDTYLDGKAVKIFEYDLHSKKFRKVYDLGGFALFLGHSNFLAKAGLGKTWFKSNCIYLFGGCNRDYIVYDLDVGNREILPCEWLSKDEKYFLRNWVSLDA